MCLKIGHIDKVSRIERISKSSTIFHLMSVCKQYFYAECLCKSESLVNYYFLAITYIPR